MVLVKNEREKTLDNYIKDIEESKKTNHTVPVIINGSQQILSAYRFRTDDLLYNKESGRLAASVKQYESENRSIIQDTENGQKIIMDILLKLDENRTKDLRKDLYVSGQLFPGVITYDGVTINGNRRKAVLKTIYNKEGLDKYNYLIAARLPKNTTEQDLFRIEAGLQYSHDFKLDYGPVNELLTIKKGLKFFNKEQMANSVLMLPNGIKELDRKMETLKYIDLYLDSTDSKEQYYIIKQQRLYSFFDDTVKVGKSLEKRKSTKDIEKYIKFAFKMIKFNKELKKGHKGIRNLKDLASSGSTKLEDRLFKAGKAIDLKKEPGKIDHKNKNKFLQEMEMVFEEVNELSSKKPLEYHIKRIADELDMINFDTLNESPKQITNELIKLTSLIKEKVKTISKSKSYLKSRKTTVR